MYLIKQTDVFSKWLHKLKDTRGKVSIIRRVDRIKSGNFGDYKSVGDEVFELRITVGPGYRVYYTQQDDEIIILLVGGDKATQTRDIDKAKLIKKELKHD